MTRSLRLLLSAGAAAALLAATGALAQTQPPPPTPGVYPPAGLQAAAPEHRLQLSAYTGWMVNGDVDTSAGSLVIDDAQSFGAALSVKARPGTRAELSWTYAKTDARLDRVAAFQGSQTFSVDTHYFQIGGLQSIKRGRVEPFGGATLGAVWYAPQDVRSATGAVQLNLSDTWRFAFTLGAGANVFLNRTETLALRLHAKMLVPVFFDGGGFYVGSGGSGVTVSGGVPAVSGDFGLGIVFSPK